MSMLLGGVGSSLSDVLSKAPRRLSFIINWYLLFLFGIWYPSIEYIRSGLFQQIYDIRFDILIQI
jgi:hypothetical protein